MKYSLLAIAIVTGASSTAWAQVGFGITRDNRIVSFESTAPGLIYSNNAIGGLNANERVLSIDARPATANGQLVILTSDSRLLSVDSAGNTTALGPAFTPLLGGSDYSIDFNPTVDRIRVVGGVGGNENFRLNPVTGGRVAGDAALTFASGGAPNAVGVAYRFWNFGGNAPVNTVREYILDLGINGLSLAEVGSMAGGNASFNAGVSTLIGALGIVPSDGLVGFDIYGPTDVAYVSANGITGTTLYSINLSTGAATAIGALGVNLTDITFAVPAPGSAALMGLGGLAMTRRRRR